MQTSKQPTDEYKQVKVSGQPFGKSNQTEKKPIAFTSSLLSFAEKSMKKMNLDC